MKGFLIISMKYKNYHYLLAQVFPLTLYFIFSLVGWGLLDSSTNIVASISVREGLLPYKDFHWIVTPLTIYTQSYFQKIFYFLSPRTISIIWKGISYSLLSLVSLIYLIKLTKRLNFQNKIPLSFIYLYPLIFMLIGPIHQNYTGYTTDALLLSCLGVLIITWPIDISNKLIRLYSWLGFFCLGLSFCSKQEIGLITIICGFIYLIVKRIVAKSDKIKDNIFLNTFIPAILLLLPTTLLFIFFYSKFSLNYLIQSIFIIPSQIKRSIFGVITSLISFGVGLDVKLFIAIIILFIVILIILYQKDTNNFNNMVDFFTFKKRKIFIMFFKYLFIIGCFFISLFFLFNKNFQFKAFFYRPIGLRFEVFFLLCRISFFLFLFTILALFIFSIIKLKSKLNKNWILHYIMPIFLLFLILDSATLAGTSIPRINRIILPLFLITFIILLSYHSRYFKNFNFSWRRINLTIIFLIFIFLSARSTGIFSSVLSDPLHSPVSWSSELNCFIDKEIYKNMKEIKSIVDKDDKADIYVYQTDPVFYLFINKKPISYSYVHFRDWYPFYLDNEEIKSIESLKVKFVITQSSHKREDSFLFRKDDPIRDYIEENYKIVMKGDYFYLWEKI